MLFRVVFCVLNFIKKLKFFFENFLNFFSGFRIPQVFKYFFWKRLSVLSTLKGRSLARVTVRDKVVYDVCCMMFAVVGVVCGVVAEGEQAVLIALVVDTNRTEMPATCFVASAGACEISRQKFSFF